MDLNTTIHCPCPNCGGDATRIYFTSQEAAYSRCNSSQVIQTECTDCDYLMVMCARNGIVIEAYTPTVTKPVNNFKILQASSGESKQKICC